MKKFIYLTVLIIATVSCNQNTKKTPQYTKGLTHLITSYPNYVDALELKYNDNNEVIEFLGSEGNADQSVKCFYDNAGLLNKLEYHSNNEIQKVKEIKRYQDSLHVTKLNTSVDENSKSFRETYIYNEDGNMIEIIRYTKVENGEWGKRGSRYEFIWENGNMVKIRSYVHNDINVNDSAIKIAEVTNESLFELDEISEEIIDEGYELFYESVYTYDDKSNPYMNLSISSILIPNKQNISKNNPLSIEKKYVSGEIMNFTYDYTYNEQNFPIDSKVTITTNTEFLPKTGFTRSFKY